MTHLDLRRLILDAADELDLDLTVHQAEALAACVARSAPAAAAPRLTGQMHAVLLSLAKGYNIPTTARLLCISPNTVRAHRKSLYRRLGARSGAHSVALAYQLQILTADIPASVDGGAR